MNKKLLILLFAMSLSVLALPSILATDYTVKKWDFVDSTVNGSDTFINAGIAGNQNGANYIYSGIGDTSANKYEILINFSYINKSFPAGTTAINNFSIEFNMQDSGAGGGFQIGWVHCFPINLSFDESTVDGTNWAGTTGGVNMTDYNGSNDLIIARPASSPSNGVRFNFSLNPVMIGQMLGISGSTIWDKGIMCQAKEASSGTLQGYSTSEHATAANRWALYANYTFETAAPPDTTPPALLNNDAYFINGEYTWQYPTKILSNTTLLRINFTTDEAATCAVMGNSTIDANKNYTDMIAGGGVQCETTGTTNHICTMQASNAFSVGKNKYVYAGCKDTAAALNELRNATFSWKTNVYTYSASSTTLGCMVVGSGCSVTASGGCNYILK